MTKAEEIKMNDLKVQLANERKKGALKDEQIEDMKKEFYTKSNNTVKELETVKSELNKTLDKLAISNCEVVDLKKKLNESIKVIKKFNKEKTKLENALTDLKASSSKDSSNSSKPPSTDLNKKIIKNSREKSDKNKGGQIGRKGVTLQPVEAPDEIIDVRGQDTCSCGGTIEYETKEYIARQVRDLKTKIEDIEYRYLKGTCIKCGKEYRAPIPQEHNNPIQYSIGIKSLVIATKQITNCSNRVIAQLLKIMSNNNLNLS